MGGPRGCRVKLVGAGNGLAHSFRGLQSPFGRRAGVGARARPVLRAPLRLRARSGPTRAKSTGADAFGAVGTRSAGSSIGTTGATDPPGMRVDGVATMPRSNGRSRATCPVTCPCGLSRRSQRARACGGRRRDVRSAMRSAVRRHMSAALGRVVVANGGGKRVARGWDPLASMVSCGERQDHHT